ncbi:MAG: adenylate kinase [Dehalococcoidia bacterium]
MNVILLGAPGAGKGTQAVELSQKLSLAHIASGDLFRQAQNSGTELGNTAKSYMEKGLLVPDEITVKMVLERISEPDCANGFILDGFPRNLEQAKALEEALKGKGQDIDKVVYIKVPEEELVRRLAGRRICRNCQTPYHVTDMPPKVEGKCDRCGGELYQRPDDNEETVRNRIRVYSEETAPLVDYYKKDGKLLEIDGSQGAEKVTSELVNALK